MYVDRPVAFDSINFLPGFPSDSVYQCDPWSTTRGEGACAGSPTVIGREQGVNPASMAIARAIAAARNAPASGLSGCGGSCGCGGTCGGGMGDDGGAYGSTSRSHQHHHASIGDFGLPDFSTIAADPVGYLKGNAFPIVLGALAVYLIKRK